MPFWCFYINAAFVVLGSAMAIYQLHAKPQRVWLSAAWAGSVVVNLLAVVAHILNAGG